MTLLIAVIADNGGPGGWVAGLLSLLTRLLLRVSVPVIQRVRLKWRLLPVVVTIRVRMIAMASPSSSWGVTPALLLLFFPSLLSLLLLLYSLLIFRVDMLPLKSQKLVVKPNNFKK